MKAALVLLFSACTLPAATIRGMVVESQTGHPMARTTVTVEPVGNGSEKQTTHTNLSGIFEFNALAAGTYHVTAAKLEFAAVQYGQKRWFSPGLPIALETDDVASLTIRLPRFAAITGAVVDENDVGLPDLEVGVYTDTRPPRLLVRATTDDRGMYRFYNLRPGSYLVRSFAKTYDDESYLPTFYRESRTVDQSHSVEVKMEEELGHVDFHAIAGRLFSVGGRVSTASGVPAVTLSSDTGTETASIDGNGNFSFHPMAPGTYELFAQTPEIRNHDRLAGFQMLTVDRDLTDVRLTLSPLPSLNVTFEDTNGRPIPAPEDALRIRRVNAAAGGIGTPFTIGTALAPGRWEVAVAPRVSYCVTGFTPQPREARVDGWNEITVSSATQNTVKFVLSRTPGTIAGTVKKANGDPAVGIPVFIEPYDLELSRRLEPGRSVKSDAKGNYSIGGLAPGVYRLLASSDFLMPEPAQMEAAQAQKITVEQGQHASLDLQEFVIR
jgi:hypothetical protein